MFFIWGAMLLAPPCRYMSVFQLLSAIVCVHEDRVLQGINNHTSSQFDTEAFNQIAKY